MNTEKPRIQTVVRFQNGMVAVCDQFGRQMPELQGRWKDKREEILSEAPRDTYWLGIRPWKIIEQEQRAMPVITQTLSEQEQAVIEAAIEFITQITHGLYRDVPDAQVGLIRAVQRLVAEHDGHWQPKPEPKENLSTTVRTIASDMQEEIDNNSDFGRTDGIVQDWINRLRTSL